MSPARNQCDGCARGLPLERGLHRGPGGFWAGDVQACTAYRYADKPIAPEVEKLLQKADAALMDLAGAVCPKCAGPIRDLRGVGFSAPAIEAEEICFLWGSDSFTCLVRRV